MIPQQAPKTPGERFQEVMSKAASPHTEGFGSTVFQGNLQARQFGTPSPTGGHPYRASTLEEFAPQFHDMPDPRVAGAVGLSHNPENMQSTPLPITPNTWGSANSFAAWRVPQGHVLPITSATLGTVFHPW